LGEDGCGDPDLEGIMFHGAGDSPKLKKPDVEGVDFAGDGVGESFDAYTAFVGVGDGFAMLLKAILKEA
jgi:hypothetical protein